MSDGFKPQCKFCTKKNYLNIRERKKEYYLDNRDRLLNMQKFYNKEKSDRIKEYQLKNHDKIIARKSIYSNNKYKTDINYRLNCKTRSRVRQALKGKIKSSSTIKILGIDIESYKKWKKILMTPEVNWTNIELDHVKPICTFNFSDDAQLKEAFNWRNTQPLLKKDHLHKGTKYNFLDCKLQFIKAYQFIKLNEEGLNEDLH